MYPTSRHVNEWALFALLLRLVVNIYNIPREDGLTLGISGLGCAAGTLEPLTCSRASSAESCYPILE